MAETTYTKYPIKRLNDTYYEISKTTSFWSSKEKFDHSFYVNGYHHSIGAYSLSERLFWTDFVDFLNQTCFSSSSNYREAFRSPVVQWFLGLIDGFAFKDIHTSIMSFKFQRCSSSFKQVDGVSKVDSVTIMPNNKSHCDVLADMLTQYYSVNDANIYINGNKYREISGSDFRAIISVVQLSFLCYLPKMVHSFYFTFHNDPSIINIGLQKGWLR